MNVRIADAMNKRDSRANTKPIGTHKGDKTQNHDQSIYPVNFRPMNRMVSIPKNPIPPCAAVFDLLIKDYFLVSRL